MAIIRPVEPGVRPSHEHNLGFQKTDAPAKIMGAAVTLP
jgi:hypothetical protein